MFDRIKNLFAQADDSKGAVNHDAAAVEINDDLINEILNVQILSGTTHRIAELVTQRERVGSTLNLSLKLPAGFTGDAQALHDELANALEPRGINELNLHLVSQKVSGSAAAQKPQPAPENKLPIVTDASAPVPTSTPTRPVPPKQTELKAHPRIRHIIVVASGKGGVGKSTTAVNLALALQKTGAKVGMLDADIYGPSIPTMLGIAGRTPLIENDQFVPIAAHGLAVLSIGNLTGDDNTPIVWRGPKATGALMQLFGQTNWPELDYLVIDMPPGTGDIQLTLAQRIPVSGAVIVTTPQHIALLDAQKGIELFNKVNIPVLGVIENMALHVCSQCGHIDEIFGAGGGEKLGAQYHVPLLGRLPLASSIRINADTGTPSVVAGDAAAPLYEQIALNVIREVEKLGEVHERDGKRIF
ncbi:iron-sulfur cluster carrier protein ApbC [Aquirhabdus parva]|uniref:Iron-sulfur cluster carrier protein n=1 Tax=Aquirhabdus parva TaxID=2283318 RepID=A0A345P3I9_9GAMM|nr:iron-sulfur cluster carrier protein ApbC [Aquirhabdus parva]